MEDIIIIAVLCFCICAAIVPTIQHFRGKGGCCGSGSYKPKKKKLDHILSKKIFHVEGMHCENCVNRVMMTVNDIPGVSTKVYLKKGIMEVSYANEVPDEIIIEKLERIGYKATPNK